MNYISYYSSPVGILLLTSSDEGLTGIHFENGRHALKDITSYKEENTAIFDETKRWLDIYFSAKKPNFTPLLHFTAISKEKTKRLSQAVGQAVGHNPISIIIPCHRVIGSDGSLTGYGGGIERKKYLLDLEKKY